MTKLEELKAALEVAGTVCEAAWVASRDADAAWTAWDAYAALDAAVDAYWAELEKSKENTDD
jgi:hypothetical protein